MARNRRSSASMKFAVGRGCILLLVGVLCVGFSLTKIIVGSEYVNACPSREMIPVYVLISGCLPVLLSALRQPYDGDHMLYKDQFSMKITFAVAVLGVMINLAWLVAGTFLVIPILRGTTCPTLHPNQSRPGGYGIADNNISNENSQKTTQQGPTELPIYLDVIASDGNTAKGNENHFSGDEHIYNKTLEEVAKNTLLENVTFVYLQNEDMEKKETDLGRSNESHNAVLTAERMDAVEKSSSDGTGSETNAVYDIQKHKWVNTSVSGVNTSHIDSMSSMNDNVSIENNNDAQKQYGATTNSYEVGNGSTTVKLEVQHHTEAITDEVGSGTGTVKHATRVGSSQNGISKTDIGLIKVHHNDNAGREIAGPDSCITCDIHILRFSLAVVVIDWLFVIFGAFYFCHFVCYKFASLKDQLLLINA